MVKYFLIITTLILLGCDKTIEKKKSATPITKEKQAFLKSAYFDEERVKNDKYEVMKNGDWRAYSDLILYYKYNKSKEYEILPYSLLMVEKHKKYNYCANVFQDILGFYTEKKITDFYDGEENSMITYLKNIELLSKEQKNYAISYLNLGALHKDKNSITFLNIMYRNGIGVETNFKRADSLQVIYEKIIAIESKNKK